MSNKYDEQTTSQYQGIGKKVKSHLKNYCFFLYYQRSHMKGPAKSMNLQKLSFKLKDDKNQYSQKYGDNNKNVQLNFYDLQNQNQISNSLHDLKVMAQQFKTKLVFFSSQTLMMNFYYKAKILNINVQNFPMCIYTSGLHCDFSKFIGWSQPVINNLSGLSVSQIQKDVRKWVQSPTQKIDTWLVEVKVSQEGGNIQKLNQNMGLMQKIKTTSLKQLLISNLSVGYHPNLLLNYQQANKSKQTSFLNKLRYKLHGLKKFCCVGDSDMRENTGVVKIDFVDEKGEHQILKYLRDSQLEEDSQYLQNKKKGNRKKVLSVLLSNIDRFRGEKIKDNTASKMSDQKLQLITFQSMDDSTIITSISGQISMQFSPDHEVFIQINDSCYRLQRPLSIKLQPYGKARIIINKQMLSC